MTRAIRILAVAVIVAAAFLYGIYVGGIMC